MQDGGFMCRTGLLCKAHYEVNPVDATSTQTPVAKVAELYAHVQTARKLGCDTMLESNDDGRLQVVFLKKLPPTPLEFY